RPKQLERKHDVLKGVPPREKSGLLEDVAHGSCRSSIHVIVLENRSAGEINLALGWKFQSSDDAQQRCLPAPALPQDGYEFSFLHMERDIAQRFDRRTESRKPLADAFD